MLRVNRAWFASLCLILTLQTRGVAAPAERTLLGEVLLKSGHVFFMNAPLNDTFPSPGDTVEYNQFGALKGYSDLQRNVRFALPPTQGKEIITIGSKLYSTHWIGTGPDGFVRIELQDGSVADIGPGTNLKLDESISESKPVTLVRLRSGNLAFLAGPKRSQRRFIIEIPGAHISSRSRDIFVEAYEKRLSERPNTTVARYYGRGGEVGSYQLAKLARTKDSVNAGKDEKRLVYFQPYRLATNRALIVEARWAIAQNSQNISTDLSEELTPNVAEAVAMEREQVDPRALRGLGVQLAGEPPLPKNYRAIASGPPTPFPMDYPSPDFVYGLPSGNFNSPAPFRVEKDSVGHFESVIRQY